MIHLKSLTAETANMIEIFLGMASSQPQEFLYDRKIHFPAFFQVYQPLYGVPHKSPFGKRNVHQPRCDSLSSSPLLEADSP
jgi:hypothetical protein